MDTETFSVRLPIISPDPVNGAEPMGEVVRVTVIAPEPDALWGVWERPDMGMLTPRGRLVATCGERRALAHPVVVGVRDGDEVKVPAAQLEALAARLDALYEADHDLGALLQSAEWALGRDRARAAAASAPAPAGTGGGS